MAQESGIMGQFGAIVEESCDLDMIRNAAENASLVGTTTGDTIDLPPTVKIGIARDAAFCFYYQDNIDSLRRAGAEIVFFSPLTDPLPEVHSLYLGGGYPESHLPALESSPCTKGIQRVANEGMPIYGECGGLLYLTREIDDEENLLPVQLLPASSEMTKRVQALGYVDARTHGSNPPYSLNALAIRGHEFHYSRVLPDRDAHYALSLVRGKGIDDGKDWLVSSNTIGSYTHAYFTREFPGFC